MFTTDAQKAAAALLREEILVEALTRCIVQLSRDKRDPISEMVAHQGQYALRNTGHRYRLEDLLYLVDCYAAESAVRAKTEKEKP